jgi:hypothetical protein
MILGLLGLVPFFWGALTAVFPTIGFAEGSFLGRFNGAQVMADVGIVVLSFMSGILWGFAARATGFTASLGYVLGAIPAIYVFLFVGAADPRANLGILMFGFLALLVLDRYFLMKRLAPDWWMRLRVPLTGLVSACMMVGLIAG